MQNLPAQKYANEQLGRCYSVTPSVVEAADKVVTGKARTRKHYGKALMRAIVEELNRRSAGEGDRWYKLFKSGALQGKQQRFGGV
jgi:hypothetical protein